MKKRRPSVSPSAGSGDPRRAPWYVHALVCHEREEQAGQLAERIREKVRAASRKKEVTQMGKTAAERLREEGQEMGRREEAIRSRQLTLLDQLRARFGKVPTAVKQTIEQTQDVEQLKAWLHRFAQVQSLDELGITPAS